MSAHYKLITGSNTRPLSHIIPPAQNISFSDEVYPYLSSWLWTLFLTTVRILTREDLWRSKALNFLMALGGTQHSAMRSTLRRCARIRAKSLSVLFRADAMVFVLAGLASFTSNPFSSWSRGYPWTPPQPYISGFPRTPGVSRCPLRCWWNGTRRGRRPLRPWCMPSTVSFPRQHQYISRVQLLSGCLVGLKAANT